MKKGSHRNHLTQSLGCIDGNIENWWDPWPALVHCVKSEHRLQPVRSRLQGLNSPHSPALTSHLFPAGKHTNSMNPPWSTGMLQDATLPAPAPCGWPPGPGSPTTAQKQQRFSSEKYLLSFQRYLKPRSGLPPILVYGLVFCSENKPPSTTQRWKKNTAFWGSG